MAYVIDENGNYKRTVRCGYCGEIGHNKGSCPQRLDRLNEIVKTCKERIAANEYEFEHQKNTDHNRLRHAMGQLHKVVSKGKNRKCSYCSEQGHNRRSCPKRKQDIGIFSTETKVFREKFLEKMREIGLGVGAIVRETVRVKTGDDGFEDVAALAYVEAIDWLGIDHRNKFSEDDFYYKTDCSLRLRVLGDYVNRWGDKVVTTISNPPASVSNTDGIYVTQSTLERSLRSYPGCEVVSGVDNIHPPKEYFNDKAIAKHIASEIVDAK